MTNLGLALNFAVELIGAGDRSNPRGFEFTSAVFDQYRYCSNYLSSKLQERSYHNMSHLTHMMTYLSKTLRHHELPATAAFVLFHDWTYYDKRVPQGCNEYNSVCAMQKNMRYWSLRIEDEATVALGIMATAYHDQHRPYLSNLIKHWLDADLLSLADPWDEFSANTAAIAAELNETDSQSFADSQVAFFEKLLARPSIFYLAQSQTEDLESNARANLKHYINIHSDVED